MAKMRALTVDDRVGAWCDLTLPEESFLRAFVAAGHVSVALNSLENPLTGRRGYLVADMTGSDKLIGIGLSHMSLSSGESDPSYLRQMVEGIRNLANEDLCEFESLLKDVDEQRFVTTFPVRKSRKVRGASLIFEVSVENGSWLTLRVEHDAGVSLYRWSLDEGSYILAKSAARYIYVGDSCPFFEIDFYRDGDLKPAPSFEEAGEFLELPDSFFRP